MAVQQFKALQVEEVEDKKYQSQVVQRSIEDLPKGDVLIQVQYSSINFKDALSASGNKRVTQQFPHTPGIDAAGLVISSDDPSFSEGDSVIVTGYDLGMNTAGGFGQFIRVPAAWVIKCPAGLSTRDSMIFGTAGFTAALCLEKLQVNGVMPESGPILVTGATGGVGIIAVALLSKLGYEVIASTGKKSAEELLKKLGAIAIIDRNEINEPTPRPLLKEQWAGAVDVVGGDTLFSVLKSIKYGGSVACCGLVQSPMFEASVFPFILRGVNLLGVDSVELPLEVKRATWEKLAGDWGLDTLDSFATEISLDDVSGCLSLVLAGKATGRYLVNLEK